MMSRYLRLILKPGLLIVDTMLTATGSFALMRGLRPASIEETGSDMAESDRTAGTPGKQ
jgi:hypothetical protein